MLSARSVPESGFSRLTLLRCWQSWVQERPMGCILLVTDESRSRQRHALYHCTRKETVSSRIEIRKGNPIVHPSRLDVFLTARNRLYSSWAGRLLTAEVEHEPWRLREIEVTCLEENIRSAMGAELPHDPFVAHFSPGVDTKVGPPKPV